MSTFAAPRSILSDTQAGFAPGLRRARKPLPWIVRLLLTWDARHRMRSRIADLPDHLLRDIGLSPADARAEAIKPFWQA